MVGASGSGGTTGAGGSQSNGQAGAKGTGGTAGNIMNADGGAIVPVGCRTGAAMNALPATAPTLVPGTWKNISPTQVKWGAGAANTQGMAVDPCNPSTLYLCVASNNMQVTTPGVYKSTDAGSPWKKVGKLDTPIHVRVDPKNPQHLYANDGVWGSTQGFYVSTDGGENFTKPDSWVNLAKTQNMFIDDTYDVAVDPSDFEHVLVSFHSSWGWTETKWKANAGILESKDGGNTWIVHEPGGWGYGHAIHFLYDPELGIGNSSTWLLGTQGGGMFRTTDAGATWTKVTDTGIQHGGGTIYYTKTGTLYATGADKNLRSTDNGVTWTTIGPGGGYNGIVGDGKQLYAARCFGPTPYMTAPESDALNWTASSTQQFDSGSYEMSFDAANGIVYTASWGSGMWALKVK